MWIEQRSFLFAPIQVKHKGSNFLIEGSDQQLEISSRQHDYLKQFLAGKSIHQLVQENIKKGVLISFREIYLLIEKMVAFNWILNPEIQSYFSLYNSGSKLNISSSGLGELKQHQGQIVADTNILKSLPFFRTFHSDLQKIFFSNATINTIPAQTRICKTGDTSRELFVLLDGVVGVYKTYPDGRRQLLSTVPKGSLFGEGGFLLGKPRGADVISLEKSTLAIISYNPQIAEMIDAGKAESLRHRFWVLQGLLASELFSHIPSETLDSLVFAGTLVEAKENQIIAKEGAPGNSLFIIVQGNIAFSQKGVSLRTLNQGGIFGEVALMISGGTRTATARAQRDSLLLEIQMEEFYEILSNHLYLAKEIEEIAWTRWQKRIK